MIENPTVEAPLVAPKRTRQYAIAALIVVAIAAYAWIAPYLTFWQFVSAAAHDDISGLNRAVDFEMLRDSLHASFHKSADKNLAGNPFAGLGYALGDGLIDRIATPEGVIGLMHYGSQGHDLSNTLNPLDVVEVASVHYTSISTASLSLRGTPLLQLCREGLVWKVCGLEVDPSDFPGAR